jgi:hypothetical protein
MRKIHYCSGLVITLFIVFHLINHTISIYGAEKHIQVMTLFRQFYRNIFAESILLACILVQIYSGIKLFLAKRKRVLTGFEKLQRWSGLYFVVFFIIHLSAVFGGRYLLKLDTNFYFGVAGLNTFPNNLFFIPYYGLAIFSFFAHVAAIHYKKMKSDLLSFNPSQQAKAILLIGFIFTTIIFYGLTGHFKGMAIPQQYNVLIGK